ncbi:catabolic L-serine/threonine dehydratase, partial [Coemansia sp. RSA 1878]
QALLADDERPGAATSDAPSLLPPLESGAEPDCDIRTGPSGRSGCDGTRDSGTRSEPTVATCLLAGATSERAVELTREHPVVPLSVTEAMAVDACRRLLDNHQLLVEVGSAAALSVVGKGLLRQILPSLGPRCHVVVVVTGGANISFDRLDACRQRFPFPAPIIAKSGQEIFMRMLDSALPTAASDLGAISSQVKP